MEGTELVHRAGGEERRAPLASLESARSVVEELVPAVASRQLDLDARAAARLADWYALGDGVLARLGGTATLWPEHFDIAIELGRGPLVQLRLLAGRRAASRAVRLCRPVVRGRRGQLWNGRGFAGAELGYAELLAAPDPAVAALEFMTTRRAALQ